MRYWKYFKKQYLINFLKFLLLFAIVAIILVVERETPILAQVDVPQIVIKDGQEVLLLPDNLLESIKANFPVFHVPTTSDMKDQWVSRKMPNSLPFVVWGNFNGDGLTDVAIILLSENQWKFIIFHRNDQGYIPAYEEKGKGDRFIFA